MNRLYFSLRALFVRLEVSNMILFLKDLAILARVKLLIIRFSLVIFHLQVFYYILCLLAFRKVFLTTWEK